MQYVGQKKTQRQDTVVTWIMHQRTGVGFFARSSITTGLLGGLYLENPWFIFSHNSQVIANMLQGRCPLVHPAGLW